MKRIRLIIVIGILLFPTPAMRAQDFLQKAKNYLDAGECEKAQMAYEAYKVEKPSGNAEVERRIKECLEPPKNITVKVGDVSFKMIYVEGGNFTMGCTSEKDEDYYHAKPAHQVTLDGFYMGETEVTQALWKVVMENNPSRFVGDNLPVTNVSWDDCQEFIQRLNVLTEKNFRLPTEAEWEYAARGGKYHSDYKYAGGNNINELAWYGKNSDSTTHDVKKKLPNALGIYDMNGNVWEWCGDWFGEYFRVSQTNPTGSVSEFARVRRGGGYHSYYDALGTPVYDRAYSKAEDRYNNLGLRLSLVIGNGQHTVDDGFKCGMYMKDTDNHSYKTVKIGSQCWMAQNLRTECDRDGNKLKKGEYIAPEGNADNVPQYGYLYDWTTAMIVCPKGWHLPSKKEWEILVKSCDAIGELAGGTQWVEFSGNADYRPGYPGDYSYKYRNRTGFNALPAGGYFNNMGDSDDEEPWLFEGFGYQALFWTATYDPMDDYYDFVFYNFDLRDGIWGVRFPYSKEKDNCGSDISGLHIGMNCYSVRCIR